MSRSLYWLVASLLALGLSWFLQPDLAGHGLRASYNGQATSVERIALITSNDREFRPDSPTTVKWTGYLYQSRPGEIYFYVPNGVQARLVIGDDTVFDSYAPSAVSDRAVAYTVSGFNPVSFEIKSDPSRAGYIQAGLEWQAPWRSLVPGIYLYPEPTNPISADQIIQQALIAATLFWAGVVLGLIFIIGLLWPHRAVLRSRTALGLAAISLVAFVLRLIYLGDYLAQPTADVLGFGSDHRGYQSAALDYLRGNWPPPAPFYVQPGMSLLMGNLYTLFGPNLRLVQLFQMSLGALAAVLVFAIAKRTFNELTGWIAAGLWSIFPLSIFYEAQVLTHGLEPITGLILLFLWIGLLNKPDSALKQLMWVAALGLALGLSALLRPTFLILAPFMALSLLIAYRPNWLAMVGWPTVLAITTLLPIVPITWHNYQANSQFQLLTSNSDVTLYLGNNRDATGLGEYSPAFYATHELVNQGKTTYLDQTVADIRDNPERWLQLMIRKTALYLGDQELPNNVYFYEEGAGISPTLNGLPLRFGALMALALAGVVLVGIRKSQSVTSPYTVLVIYAATQIAVVIAYHVFSRFRAPIYPILAIMAAVPLSFVLSTWQHRKWKETSLAIGVTALSGLFIWTMPLLAENVMDRPVVSGLPSTATRLNVAIDDSLILVGYESLPVVAPNDPFFITLYWQANQSVSQDYYTTVQLFSGDTKVIQADQPIGTGSFPDYPTSRWQPGQIIRDSLYMQMPKDAPTPVALSVLVAAYDRDTQTRIGETTFGVLPLTQHESITLPAKAVIVNAHLGAATLNAYAIKDQTLTLYWQAGEQVNQDGIVFVHIFDSQGNFVAGNDSRPRNGLYTTLAWQVGEGIVDEHVLPAVPAGDYTIKIGMYDAVTQNRFAVTAANGETLPDGVLPLGSITIH
jgi:4-amino-4-deoxy-L-arabinose transferase-like glycosyltransferase